MKRLAIYLVGLCILAFGIVLNTKTGLGTSAGVALPYVMADITGVTLGTFTFVLYSVFILIQILIRRKLNLTTILQLPVTLVFGLIIDLFNSILKFEAINIYMSVLYLLIAIVFIALGMTLSLSMNIVPVAIDGVVKTISERYSVSIGRVKIVFDCILVGLACCTSLVFLGEIVGVGIGTVTAALLIGKCAAIIQPWILKWIK